MMEVMPFWIFNSFSTFMEMAFFLFGLKPWNTLTDPILKGHCVFVLNHILMIKPYFNMFLDIIWIFFIDSQDKLAYECFFNVFIKF